MFLSTVNGRYWVELVDQVTADWESLRMNHGIAKEFREAMRSRTVVPSVALASARFFSLRNRNADPVSTAMTLKGRVQIGLGRSNQSPFPEFVQDYSDPGQLPRRGVHHELLPAQADRFQRLASAFRPLIEAGAGVWLTTRRHRFNDHRSNDSYCSALGSLSGYPKKSGMVTVIR